MPDDTHPTASGRDLARQALNSYKAGRTPGQPAGSARRKNRRTREDRTGGRDPIGLGGVLGRLATEQAWKTSLDGGSVIDQWPTICPDRYRSHLEPVAFDPQLGRLDIRPDSPAYATELRMFGPMLAKELNTKMGRDVVRTIRILRVGTVTSAASEGPASKPGFETAAPAAGPVRTRETASPGYRQALETALAHKPDRTRHLTPGAAAAIARQNQALTEHREPETAFTDAVAEQERLEQQAARQQPTDPLKAAVQAALQYKHHGGSTSPVRRLFEAS